MAHVAEPVFAGDHRAWPAVGARPAPTRAGPRSVVCHCPRCRCAARRGWLRGPLTPARPRWRRPRPGRARSPVAAPRPQRPAARGRPQGRTGRTMPLRHRACHAASPGHTRCDSAAPPPGPAPTGPTPRRGAPAPPWSRHTRCAARAAPAPTPAPVTAARRSARSAARTGPRLGRWPVAAAGSPPPRAGRTSRRPRRRRPSRRPARAALPRPAPSRPAAPRSPGRCSRRRRAHR